MRVLLTGGAGFIGSHTAEALLQRGDDVIIVDEMNDYYDITIKQDNLALLQKKYSTQNASGPGKHLSFSMAIYPHFFM